jgi:hypothetical protein
MYLPAAVGKRLAASVDGTDGKKFISCNTIYYTGQDGPAQAALHLLARQIGCCFFPHS